MNIFTSVKEYIKNLDEKSLYQHLIAACLGVIIVLSALGYWHARSASFYRKKLKVINEQRALTRSILEKHTLVKQQQTQVNAILSRDTAFKIKEYFDSIVAQLGLTNYNTKQSEVSDPRDLQNGYAEIKLATAFTDINMKQLCELLYKIEQNERIYTKELVITKALKTPAIDVTLVIATLQPSSTSE